MARSCAPGSIGKWTVVRLAEIRGEACLQKIAAAAIGDVELALALVPVAVELGRVDVADEALEAAMLLGIAHLQHQAAIGARGDRPEVEALGGDRLRRAGD